MRRFALWRSRPRLMASGSTAFSRGPRSSTLQCSPRSGLRVSVSEKCFFVFDLTQKMRRFACLRKLRSFTDVYGGNGVFFTASARMYRPAVGSATFRFLRTHPYPSVRFSIVPPPIRGQTTFALPVLPRLVFLAATGIRVLVTPQRFRREGGSAISSFIIHQNRKSRSPALILAIRSVAIARTLSFGMRFNSSAMTFSPFFLVSGEA